MTHRILAYILIALISIAAPALAQDPAGPGPVVAGAVPLGPKPGTFGIHLENAMDAAPVKGIPFCATISTEHTQNFADGNRIHTTDSSTLCRDAEGRTRRDSNLNLLGAGPQNSGKLVTIVDPVGGVRYILDPDNKVAHKSSAPAEGKSSVHTAGGPGSSERVFMFQSAGIAPGGGPNVVFRSEGHDHSDAAHASEDLGVQSINGIRATGTRMTTTLPAGEMGNDKPMLITSERWYSSELQATVMTKHNDPWAGELKTEFTGVNTSEPDASLFTVPSDYKVIDDKDGPMTIRMMAPAPPTP